MLSLSMKSGDYLTINGNIVVQVFRDSGPQFRVSVQAPREVPIVRGEVAERSGGQRPDGLLTQKPKKCPSDQLHSAKHLEKVAAREEAQARRNAAAAEMRSILDRMDTPDPALREGLDALRTQLDRMTEGD